MSLPATAPLLSLEHVRRRFGSIVALDDVSFEVGAGQIVGLIGPNGAGKTTLFNLITRLYELDGGSIAFEGNDLRRTPAHDVVRAGIARTFQNVELFGSMSVLENVLVGVESRAPGRRRDGERRAVELLDYVGAGDVARRPVAGLPLVTRKQIALARALAAEPRLLLLDEPASGLGHEEVEQLAAALPRLRDELSLSVLLVEHHMSLVMRISQTVHVLHFGRLIASGTPTQVRRNPAVIEAYLGPTGDAAA